MEYPLVFKYHCKKKKVLANSSYVDNFAWKTEHISVTHKKKQNFPEICILYISFAAMHMHSFAHCCNQINT